MNTNFIIRVLIVLMFFVQGCKASINPDGTVKAKQETIEDQQNQVPSPENEEKFIKNELIVKFKGTVTNQEMETIISSIGARTLKVVSKERKTYLVLLPEELSVEDAIIQLSKRTSVLYAEPNRIYTLGGE